MQEQKYAEAVAQLRYVVCKQNELHSCIQVIIRMPTQCTHFTQKCWDFSIIINVNTKRKARKPFSLLCSKHAFKQYVIEVYNLDFPNPDLMILLSDKASQIAFHIKKIFSSFGWLPTGIFTKLNQKYVNNYFKNLKIIP